jgi:hypothetical protein
VPIKFRKSGKFGQKHAPDGRLVGFSYDADSNLTSITPPGRPMYNFMSNVIDLVTSFVEPTVGSIPTSTTYSYNLDKQLSGVLRPDGTQINYYYDVKLKPGRERWPSA